MSHEQFEVLEHTADQAIRVWGADLRELVENAAAGMLFLLYIAPPPAPEATLERAIEAPLPELVVHHALRELLYLLEDEALAPVSVQVLAASETSASFRVGVVERERVEPIFGAPIKAVTMHNLELHRTERGLQIEIVFDV